MSDRTAELLTQLIDLQQRQLGLQEASLENQRVALAGQQESLQTQRALVARQRRWLSILLVLFGLMFALTVIPYALQWYRYLSYRP